VDGIDVIRTSLAAGEYDVFVVVGHDPPARTKARCPSESTRPSFKQSGSSYADGVVLSPTGP
jgi:hypothetical protein